MPILVSDLQGSSSQAKFLSLVFHSVPFTFDPLAHLMYPLPCPACQQTISVTNSQAGSSTTCPHCGNVVAVPKLGDLRRLAEVAGPSTVPSAASSVNEGGEFRRAAFAVVITLAGIAGLGGGFCAIRYWNVDVPGTTEMHLEEVRATFKQVPASQLVREYQQMERYGLEVSQPYVYKKLELEKAGWLKNTMIALGIFGGLALLAIILGSTGRRTKSQSR